MLFLLGPPALLVLLLAFRLEGFAVWWYLASALFMVCALLEPAFFHLLERHAVPWVLLAAGPRPLVALLRGAPLPAREGAQLHLYETVAARGGWVSALVAAEAIEQRMGAEPAADERGARSNAAPRGRWRRVVDVALQSRCLLVPS